MTEYDSRQYEKNTNEIKIVIAPVAQSHAIPVLFGGLFDRSIRFFLLCRSLSHSMTLIQHNVITFWIYMAHIFHLTFSCLAT